MPFAFSMCVLGFLHEGQEIIRRDELLPRLEV